MVVALGAEPVLALFHLGSHLQLLGDTGSQGCKGRGTGAVLWGQSPAPTLALPPGKGIGVVGANLPAASSPLCKIWEAFLTGGGCCSGMGPQAGLWWVLSSS